MSAENPDSSTRGQQPLTAAQRGLAPGKPTYFPLGYKAAVSQWWQSISPAVAEHNVMSFVPYLQKPPTHTQTGSAPVSAQQSSTSINSDPERKATPVRTNSINDPYGPRSWHSNLVHLSGKNRALNEFSVQRDDEEVEENLVMLHGYGAGLGFFYKNFEGLSRVKGWKIYALDMLGMGRSSRPPFKVHAKDQAGKISEAESWFVDALEEWRVLKKIDKFTLLGHSMGGYMAVAYALKYPGHLNKLVLASPVGIPEDPYAVQAAMPEPGDSTMASEFLQDQEEESTQHNGNLKTNGDNNKFLNARSKAEAAPKAAEAAPPRRPLPKWLTYLWDANISPFSVVRWTGPLGPRFVSGWTSRRFSHLPEQESEALHNYAYSLFRQRGSGEYALAYILAPGAFARSPLIRRIQGVGRQSLPPPSSSSTASSTTPTSSLSKETGIPVILMYGENDWMDVAGGFAAEQKIKEEKAKALKAASAEEKRRENGSAKVVIIKKAGHHVYLDGWEEFNEVMRAEMEETKRHSKAAAAANGRL
ncbi:putative cardiolipin-specific deacylase, mitochondrial [Lachnellula occidentalis]|uniref:Putative cardiolipin-specific deacylase, mitochondrial n=1 Tax=Lachnellula occidentalis TaxID=215460 RepID=A0A8H8RJ13_9HELO|nr:putative cardiolipin-specific deacylase, mitochondrial [Lachnellula occidentalis]